MIFIGTHSKWMRCNNELLSNVLHFVSAFPDASPLNELASFAKSFALKKLVIYHRYYLLSSENIHQFNIHELIKHLQNKICFIRGIHKLQWIESIILLCVAISNENIYSLLSDFLLNRPIICLSLNKDNEEETYLKSFDGDNLKIELQMLKSAFSILESADARHFDAIQLVSVEFLNQILNSWINFNQLNLFDSEIFILLSSLIDEVIFCAKNSFLPHLNSLIQFLGFFFEKTKLSCFLHSFSTCFSKF